MRIYFLTSFLLAVFVLPLSAQKKFSSYLENYKHTISYADHKVTLHVQPDDRTPNYTDLTKSYYWYSNNAIRITQGGFSGKLLHGLYSSYYDNKSLQEQGYFKMGLKTGEWKNWAEDGQLISDVSFNKGVPEGNFYKYDGHGKLIEKGENLDGKLEGELIRYQGDSTLSVKYKNGVVVPPKVKTKTGPGFIKHFFKKKPKTENIVKPI
ncbi:antitoxin component YwqK of YwqJK toxin-antitoxin module [Pedobacter cryoconitis]|uniref:toxin-antitoxin system YwqK family antitoxin n=1 Tax=Pedobacter cryoconitis TaxID=188932 RepID=UPI00160EFC7A|nr:hypothetical protein [Pedobacter cryoconitis]MBB6273348.1 antitoxin component YwqK of YwqJK toxin-antitoxin module [Pedobacter cryoconitis]